MPVELNLEAEQRHGWVFCTTSIEAMDLDSRLCFLVIAVVAVSAVGFAIAPNSSGTSLRPRIQSGRRVCARSKAFTQGLVVVDNLLYEGTGCRRIDAAQSRTQDGRVMTYVPLDATYFARESPS